ncbi:MAG: hypothetical protein QOD72_1951, partial [Acidimicrobiaceae bacterium]|nr:hypothetical protein [Acidimicrobiaceae bacterium]
MDGLTRRGRTPWERKRRTNTVAVE